MLSKILSLTFLAIVSLGINHNETNTTNCTHKVGCFIKEETIIQDYLTTMYFYHHLNIPSILKPNQRFLVKKSSKNLLHYCDETMIVCLKKRNKNLAFWAETIQKAKFNNEDMYDTMNEILEYYLSGESMAIFLFDQCFHCFCAFDTTRPNEPLREEL